MIIDNLDHDLVDYLVDYSISKLQQYFGGNFLKVFKTITSDNGSEFSNLSMSLKDVTDVYFARPYAHYERGSNERHNGLLRRYIPIGKAISNYSTEVIQRVYQMLNNLLRKILDYQQKAVLLE
ncbi:IS30 family transposase [Sporosarcina sp. FA9]|uniref:IS30 family transposase n=1 Tax=Sporosarcina sp. FA9 TaxID=3413030 RepID=UPI003F655213